MRVRGVGIEGHGVHRDRAGVEQLCSLLLEFVGPAGGQDDGTAFSQATRHGDPDLAPATEQHNRSGSRSRGHGCQYRIAR